MTHVNNAQFPILQEAAPTRSRTAPITPCPCAPTPIIRAGSATTVPSSVANAAAAVPRPSHRARCRPVIHLYFIIHVLYIVLK